MSLEFIYDPLTLIVTHYIQTIILQAPSLLQAQLEVAARKHVLSVSTQHGK